MSMDTGSTPMSKILIVDDSPDSRLIMRRTLDAHGYETEEAATGEDAMRFLATSGAEFELVLLDLILPDMHGLQILDAIAHMAEDKRPKCCVVSGKRDHASVA